MREVLEILIAARQLLSEPGRWKKFVHGFDRTMDCYGETIGAVQSCCVVGAVAFVHARHNGNMSDPASDGAFELALEALVDLIPPIPDGEDLTNLAVLTFFNDARETTHERIVDLFDRAIAQRRAFEACSNAAFRS